MKIALVGFGCIGGYILKQLQKCKHKHHIFIFDKVDVFAMKKYLFDIVFLTTPMKAVEEISKYINGKPLIVTTIKGIYKNKIVSDYFNNVIVLNGYYTPEWFSPIFIYEHEYQKNLLEEFFPLNQYKKENIKDALITNYLKNLYLIIWYKTKSINIFNDIKKLPLSLSLKYLLLEDLWMSKELESRNYRFSKMFYKEERPLKDCLDKLGLVEGFNSFQNNTKFHYSTLLNYFLPLVKEDSYEVEL